jgi:hypothetical protein
MYTRVTYLAVPGSLPNLDIYNINNRNIPEDSLIAGVTVTEDRSDGEFLASFDKSVISESDST